MGSTPSTLHDSDPHSDIELVAAANAGGEAAISAFDALYRRHRDWVVSLAWRFTHDRELALDVMQETFVYLLGKFPGFVLTAHMKTFLYPVVRHLAISIQSRLRREATGVESDDDPWSGRGPEHDESLRQLGAAVAELPAGQREVLILRFAEDLSLEQIAAAMELPLGTVKSRLHNALATLRDDLRTKNYFEE